MSLAVYQLSISNILTDIVNMIEEFITIQTKKRNKNQQLNHYICVHSYKLKLTIYG